MRRNDSMLAKITRPYLTSVYQRTGLYDLLDELSSAPLILVSGVAGSGKTTLVASYVERRNIPCLWYQLDRDDVDLSYFFHALTSETLMANPHKKAALPRVPRPATFGDSSYIKNYFRKLFQCLERPFLIVLDDYQEVPRDAHLHDVIQAACAELPQGGRIVLISGNGSPSKISGGVADRKTAVIGNEELQLSLAEIKEIAVLHGVALPSDDAAKQLHAQVGGWVSGLVLALNKESANSSRAGNVARVG